MAASVPVDSAVDNRNIPLSSQPPLQGGNQDREMIDQDSQYITVQSKRKQNESHDMMGDKKHRSEYINMQIEKGVIVMELIERSKEEQIIFDKATIQELLKKSPFGDKYSGRPRYIYGKNELVLLSCTKKC